MNGHLLPLRCLSWEEMSQAGNPSLEVGIGWQGGGRRLCSCLGGCSVDDLHSGHRRICHICTFQAPSVICKPQALDPHQKLEPQSCTCLTSSSARFLPKALSHPRKGGIWGGGLCGFTRDVDNQKSTDKPRTPGSATRLFRLGWQDEGNTPDRREAGLLYLRFSASSSARFSLTEASSSMRLWCLLASRAATSFSAYTDR